MKTLYESCVTKYTPGILFEFKNQWVDATGGGRFGIEIYSTTIPIDDTVLLTRKSIDNSKHLKLTVNVII